MDAPSQQRGELVVVTGMTGAGRSTAAKELEDLGFYVVDNLPPALLPEVVRLVDETHGTDRPIGVVIDVRSGVFFDALRANLAQGETGRRTTLVFLDAGDEVLVRRQDAARRPHPLQGDGRLHDGLAREREVLATLRSEAHLVVDTTASQTATTWPDSNWDDFATPTAPKALRTIDKNGAYPTLPSSRHAAGSKPATAAVSTSMRTAADSTGAGSASFT